MQRIIDTLRAARDRIAQDFDRDASVMVQFAAGEWHAMMQVLKEMEADVGLASAPVAAAAEEPDIDPSAPPVDPTMAPAPAPEPPQEPPPEAPLV